MFGDDDIDEVLAIMLLMKYLSFAGGDDAGEEQFTSSISPTLKMMDYMDQDAEDEDGKNSKGGEDNQSEKFDRRAKCSTNLYLLPRKPASGRQRVGGLVGGWVGGCTI